MRRMLIICFSILPVLTVAGMAQDGPDKKPGLSLSAAFGSNAGVGGELNGIITNPASGFPMHVKLGVGYISTSPGSSADARRIFINDATNGVPESSGSIMTFEMDFLYPISLFAFEEAYFYGGPRYTRFKGNFKYIGGNEDFDVRSDQWGVGSGIESYFPISPVFDLSLTGGLNYMFEGNLQGHDTEYSPDALTGNERNDYTYDDADAAINQPKLELALMLGVRYNF